MMAMTSIAMQMPITTQLSMVRFLMIHEIGPLSAALTLAVGAVDDQGAGDPRLARPPGSGPRNAAVSQTSDLVELAGEKPFPRRPTHLR